MAILELEDEIVVYSQQERAGMPADLNLLRDGSMVCAFREASNHTSIDGRIVFKRSSDVGLTWGPIEVIREPDDPPCDFRDPSITELSDGTLICTFFIYNAAGHDVAADRNHIRSGDTIIVVRSHDGGLTWPEEQRLSLSDLRMDWILTTERCLELPSGRVLMPVWGVCLESGNHIAGCLSSDDGGATWQRLSTAHEAPWDSELPFSFESSIARTSSGRLVFVSRHRIDGMYQAYSEDDGQSWKGQHLLPDSAPSTQPSLTRLADGRLMLTYGNRRKREDWRESQGDFKVEGRLSDDEGDMWSEPFAIRRHLPNMDMGYPTCVEYAPNRIATVYWLNLGERFVGPYATVCRRFTLTESTA